MRTLSFLSIMLLVSVAFSGCYHATIEMDRTPSNVVIDQPWALGFVYGLVPPPTVDASEKCTDGVAKVETKLSFLNQVVSALTFGIVTPMHITVTCAAPDNTASTDIPEEQMLTVPEGSTTEEIQEIYRYASDLAVQNEAPVYVRH
ncbi:MAG: hypothetical protein AAFW89_01355 [Bacteroidota bacterium]